MKRAIHAYIYLINSIKIKCEEKKEKKNKTQSNINEPNVYKACAAEPNAVCNIKINFKHFVSCTVVFFFFFSF